MEIHVGMQCRFCRETINIYHTYHTCAYYYDESHIIRLEFDTLENTIALHKMIEVNGSNPYGWEFNNKTYDDIELFTSFFNRIRYFSMLNINEIFDADPIIININMLDIINSSSSAVECFDKLKLMVLYN
jgi:hypothetical protein